MTAKLPNEIATAVATMTAPYLGSITPADILERLSPQKEPKEELYTVQEASERLTVSPITIHRMLSDGRLRKIKIGRSVRVPASSVEAIINGVE